MIHFRPKLKPPVEMPNSESDYLAPRIFPSSSLRPDQPHYDEVPDGPRSRSASPTIRTSANTRIPTEVTPEPDDRNTRDPRKLYKTEATIRLSDRENDMTTSL